MTDRPRVDPYDFVPLGIAPVREKCVGHARYSKGRNIYSGLLLCTLTAMTPIFTYDPRFRRVNLGHETVNFPVFNRIAQIQGSSLKGVIRSLIEAIEPCCVAVPAPFRKTYRGTGITRDKEPLTVYLPGEFEHCDGERLCLACRMFGTLNKATAYAYAGKVSIGDARSAPGDYQLLPHVTLDVLSPPKPEGRPNAYTGVDGKTIRGRKFYRHRYPPDVLKRMPDRTGKPRQDHLNKTVQPIETGSVFHFEVEYGDLNDAELRLLLYGLVLEDGLWHKLGLGKPIGLGSARIEVIKWTRIDRQARYRALGAGVEPALEEEALQAELSGWVQGYRTRESEALEKLRDILRPNEAVDVRYPVPAMPRS
ncbi:MAG: RAMP superfamily CRISPR-associated protein [bacterium]